MPRIVWPAAAAVAAVVVVSGVLLSSSAQTTPTTASMASGMQVFEAQIVPTQALAVINVRNLGAQSQIDLLDSTSGRTLAKVASASSPLVVFRSSRDQLLISDVESTLGAGRGDPLPRLRIFDLHASLRVVATIPMTDRAMYTIYTPTMRLSRDERFLFYAKQRNCGPECNDISVGVVDLDARTELSSVRLPLNCGTPLFTAWNASDIIAMCPISGSLWEVSSTGRATAVASGLRPFGLYGGITPSGEPYWVTTSGELTVISRTGDVTRQSVAPTGAVLTSVWRWEMEDGTLVFGVKPTNTATEMTGLIVVNRVDWSTAVMALPVAATFAAPMPGGSLAMLTADGSVTRMDVRTGRALGPSFVASRNVEPWIVTGLP